jgi:phytoene dehydrogenase-like protein
VEQEATPEVSCVRGGHRFRLGRGRDLEAQAPTGLIEAASLVPGGGFGLSVQWMDRERWDVIVIGAGLGGMLAAAILARRGRRVLVLEREASVGGRLRSYDVDGFVIDVGAFLWPNAHLSTALESAGVTDFLASQIPPNEVMRIYIQGRGGQRFSFPWPGRHESSQVLESADAALHADPETWRRLAQLWEDLAGLSDETVESLMHTPLRDALPRFAPDDHLAAALRRNVMLFGTYDPDSASMGDCIRLRRRAHNAPPPVPECAGANPSGGVRALASALHTALVTHAVDVRLAHTVDRIVIEGHRVVGVDAHAQAPFQFRCAAPVVICNAPIWTLSNLVGLDCLPHNLAQTVRHFGPVGGVIAAAFAFKALPRLRQTGEPDTFRGWTRLLIGPQAEFGGGMLWTTHHSPHNAPPGCHLLQAMRLSPHREIADARRVTEVHAAFDALLREIYVDADEQLLWSRRWVTRDGSEYLITAVPRPAVRAPGVEGLYFVGESTDVPAVQMDAAALSALRCVEMIEAGGEPERY